MFRSLVIAGAALVSVSAFAADLGYKKPAPVAATSAMCKEKKALPADAFGFATGSDVMDLGAWAGAVDNTYVAGGRGGKAYGYTGVAQVSTSFFPCLEVGPYLYYSLAGFKPFGGAETKGTVLGGGVEMKYKVFGRATHGVGMTLAVSPNFGAYNGFTIYGGHSSVFSNSYRMLVDAELVKDKLYGALNIELFQSAYDNTRPGFRNLSQFNVRGALTYAATDALFVGAEANVQIAKTGMWADGRFRASAAYVGPTFLWAINDKWTLNGTFRTQIAGTDKTGPGRKLGTAVFPVNQARLKLAYTF
ncbi:MAG: hypothetical protein LCH39_12025 [Proteobacteria bacterium]|nr:hypothetical protein [Pseudomonadota bacterium]